MMFPAHYAECAKLVEKTLLSLISVKIGLRECCPWSPGMEWGGLSRLEPPSFTWILSVTTLVLFLASVPASQHSSGSSCPLGQPLSTPLALSDPFLLPIFHLYFTLAFGLRAAECFHILTHHHGLCFIFMVLKYAWPSFHVKGFFLRETTL